MTRRQSEGSSFGRAPPFPCLSAGCLGHAIISRIQQPPPSARSTRPGAGGLGGRLEALQRCGTPRVGYYRGWWGGRVLGRVHNPLNPRVSQCTKSRKTRKTQNTPSNRTLNPDATRRGRYPSTRKARGLLFRRHSWRRARSPSCKTQGHQPHCGRLAAFVQPPTSRLGTLAS